MIIHIIAVRVQISYSHLCFKNDPVVRKENMHNISMDYPSIYSHV
jgi:hypothetical protein